MKAYSHLVTFFVPANSGTPDQYTMRVVESDKTILTQKEWNDTTATLFLGKDRWVVINSLTIKN